MCNLIKHSLPREVCVCGGGGCVNVLHKSLLPNKICAFNKQIILIINLLPKQLVINYNLVINDLVLTAWGSCNQTLIIHGVIKFIGAPPPTPPTLSFRRAAG